MRRVWKITCSHDSPREYIYESLDYTFYHLDILRDFFPEATLTLTSYVEKNS